MLCRKRGYNPGGTHPMKQKSNLHINRTAYDKSRPAVFLHNTEESLNQKTKQAQNKNDCNNKSK